MLEHARFQYIPNATHLIPFVEHREISNCIGGHTVTHIYNSLTKKFDLTCEHVDFLYNLYTCLLVPVRGFHSKNSRSSNKSIQKLFYNTISNRF